MEHVENNNIESLYKPTFSKNEFQLRLEKLSNIIKIKNLHSILLFSPELLYYFTGLRGSSYYVPQFLYYDKNKKLLLILRKMDIQAAYSTTYLKKSEILAYPDNYVENENLHVLQLFDFIKKSDQIGIELNGHYSISKHYIILLKMCNTIIDITYDVNMIKTIKSESELDYIRKAAEITDKAMQLVIQNIREGITSSEIAAIILNCQMNLGGTYPAIAPMIMVNENSGHMNWTNDKLKKGDIIKIEFASSYLHYHCPISRTIIIGPAIIIGNSKISQYK